MSRMSLRTYLLMDFLILRVSVLRAGPSIELWSPNKVWFLKAVLLCSLNILYVSYAGGTASGFYTVEDDVSTICL